MRCRLNSNQRVHTQKTRFLWMNCGLVNIEGILPLESLSADVTSVEEHARKMDCLEVVFNFGRQFGLENIADGTMVFLHRRIAHNVLCQVLRAQRA